MNAEDRPYVAIIDAELRAGSATPVPFMSRSPVRADFLHHGLVSGVRLIAALKEARPRACPASETRIQEYLSVNPQVWIAVQPGLVTQA